MAIYYLERTEIDVSKWDACISSNFETASLFAYVWYLDACCEQWSALVCDDYVSVMPLPWKKKGYLYYVYPPFFLPRLGIVGAAVPVDDFPLWVNAVPSKYKWIDIILNTGNRVERELYSHFEHTTYLLDCSLSYEEIKKGYHQNHKRNCLKARNEELRIVNNFSMKAVIDLFHNYNTTKYKVGFKEQDYQRLLRLLQGLHEKQQLETWGVFDKDGTLCAGAFFPFMDGKYYFLFSGRNEESTKNKAMFFLVDSFIQQHANQKIVLDFNGSNNSQLAKFYAGFGAEKRNFYELYFSRLNPVEDLLFSLYQKIR